MATRFLSPHPRRKYNLVTRKQILSKFIQFVPGLHVTILIICRFLWRFSKFLNLVIKVSSYTSVLKFSSTQDTQKYKNFQIFQFLNTYKILIRSFISTCSSPSVLFFLCLLFSCLRDIVASHDFHGSFPLCAARKIRTVSQNERRTIFSTFGDIGSIIRRLVGCSGYCETSGQPATIKLEAGVLAIWQTFASRTQTRAEVRHSRIALDTRKGRESFSGFRLSFPTSTGNFDCTICNDIP